MAELRKAGVSLEVQGKASYIASIKEVQRAVKDSTTEMKRNIEMLGNNAKAVEKHSAKMKGLATQLQLTERQLKTYNDRQDYLKKSLSEYSDKVKTVNDKLKTQKSTYESVGRTLDQQKQKVETLKTAYNQSNVAVQNAKRDLENYKQSSNASKEGVAQLTNKLKSLRAEHKLNGAELKSAKANLQSAKSEYKNLGSELSQTQQKFNELNSSEREQSRELENLNSKVLQAETSYHKLKNSMDKAQTEFRNSGGRFADTAQKWTSAGSKLQTVGSTLNSVGNGVTAATSGIALGMGYVAREAINFESAFAGVRKTVDGSPQELDAIKKSYIDLSTKIPIAATELSNIGEVAGQLGIKKENLVQFTRVIADLSNTTNLSSEEAATSLAQFMNVMNTSKTDVDRLGSSVVSLGNNFATNERDLVNMAQRLSGVGNQIHMTEADVLGLAASMSSVGIEAEAGGSAMTQVLTKMQNAVAAGGEDLEDFASAAKMSAEDFSKAFKKRPVEALEALLKGLNETEKAGGNMNRVLGDLGIKGLRESDAVKRLSGALDGDSGLAKAISVANRGWEENNALTKEAETRYGTTESQLQKAKNEITKTAIEIGEQFLPKLVQMVENAKPVIKMAGDLLLAFTKLPPGMQVAILGAGPFLKMLGTLTSALGTGAQGVGGLIKLFGKFSTGKAVGELGKLEGAAMQAGSAAPLLSNPYVLAGLAITAAVAGLGYLVYKEMTKDNANHEKAVERTNGKYQEWFKEVTEGAKRTERELPGIKKNIGQIGDTYEKEAARIKKANTQIQESFDRLFDEGGWLGLGGKGRAISILEELGFSEEEIAKVKAHLADINTMLESSMSDIIDTFGKQKVVSADMANGTIKSVNDVTNSIIEGLNQQKQSEMDRIDSQLSNHVISKADYDAQKNEIETTFNQTASSVKVSQDKINSIMREAAQENRSISTKEMKVIMDSYDNLAKQSGQSISELSTKHGELGDALRRLTSETAVNSLKQSGIIDDHAAHTINSLNRTEDKYNAIKQAIDQYNGYTLHDKKLDVKDGATKVLFEATEGINKYNGVNPHRLDLEANDRATFKIETVIQKHKEIADKKLVILPFDAVDGVSPKVQEAKANIDTLPLDKTITLFGNNQDATSKIEEVKSNDIPDKTSVILGNNKQGMDSIIQINGTQIPNKTITSLGDNRAAMGSLHEVNNTSLPSKTVSVTAETGGFWSSVNGIIGSVLGSAFISVSKIFEHAEGGNITPYAQGGNVIPFANGATRVQSLSAGNVGLVGEAGPELFTVHNKGVHIQPLSTREKFKGIGGLLKEKGLGGSSDITINIQNTINNDMDIEYVTKKTITLLKREFRENEMFGG